MVNYQKPDLRYLELLSRDYPNIESVASEMINLSALRSLPKGTEYFFSDLHGEYDSFLRLIRSASGMIKAKIDLIFEKSISSNERSALALLIYYPETEIKSLIQSGEMNDEWRRITIYRLILVCESVSAKYTRAEVRKKMPKSFDYILDELLNVTDDINREYYYSEIISSILETGIADEFIIAVCSLIRSLTIDRLHIIGDIFDRGPRADRIIDELMTFDHIDIQWGNHDISWMGAASGNSALIANVIRIALGYNSYDILEDGYGLNLRPLSIFATEVYRDDPCTYFYPHTLDDVLYDSVEHSLTAKMHKAIAVIQFKLEGQLMAAHPEYNLDSRRLFEKTDFRRGVCEIDGVEYKLRDTNFPTVDPDSPLTLSPEESELVRILHASFHHSTRLNNHIKFLYAHGSMYKCANGNLLYHGCIPMNEDGTFREITLPFKGDEEKTYHGKALLDRIGKAVNRAYFAPYGSDEQREAADYMWYLWCGKDSPLYGKDKMAFFERTLIGKDAGIISSEHYEPYYHLNNREDICDMILQEFGLCTKNGHIINGHVPVLIRDGESPIKANGKLFVIDGGISKAYRVKTGIAGYTLIYDSHSLRLAEHKPYDGHDANITPNVSVVVKMEKRVNIADIDFGEELLLRITDLRHLLEAYRDGTILEKFN
ncbi:MAG: fructose-1,6-bisphosphatase [Ruminococcaceae bacterium]|nr:fructose-1,6-bisphosphatase [Oscillospiraceae bacterium]